MEFEVVEVERKCAVFGLANQAADLVDHRRPPVAGKSHDFVLVLVDREAEIGGERRIQQAERMGKSDFTQQRDRGSAVRAPHAVADRERGPLSHAVRGQNRGAVRRSGEKRCRRMRLVVPGEEDLPRGQTEVGRNRASYPDLVAERALHRLGKRPPGVREGAQRTREDPIELQHRPLVEDDRVEIVGFETGLIETPVDRQQRKRRIILPPRQPLLLHSAHRHTVDDQRGGRVVVMRRNTEELHGVRLSTAV